MKSLAPNVCEVTMVANARDGGYLPAAIVNAKWQSSMNVIETLLLYYERRHLIVDREVRDHFGVRIPVALVTEEVREIVGVQQQQLDKSTENKQWENLIKDSSVFVKLQKVQVEGEHNSCARASTTVDESAEAVLSYLWEYCNYERIAAVENFEKNPREEIKSIGRNHKVLSTVKNLPWPLRPRHFVNEYAWMRDTNDGGSFVLAWRPFHEDVSSLVYFIP